MAHREAGQPPASRQVPLIWTLQSDAAPIVYVNQVMSQFHEDGFVVSFGQVMPPALMGTPEQVAQQAARIDFVESRTVARIALTARGMEEMVRLLSTNLDAFQKQKGGQ